MAGKWQLQKMLLSTMAPIVNIILHIAIKCISALQENHLNLYNTLLMNHDGIYKSFFMDHLVRNNGTFGMEFHNKCDTEEFNLQLSPAG